MPPSPATLRTDPQTAQNLRAFHEGDAGALSTLLQEAWPWLTGIVARWVRSEGYLFEVGPEDVAQEGIIRALRNHASFRGRTPASFRAWLIRITRNHWLDLVHKQARRGETRLPVRCEAETEAARDRNIDWATPGSTLSQREWRGELYARLAELRREERLVLVFREVLDLPWETTRALLERPSVKAARSFHARARKRLSAKMRIRP